MRKIINRKNFSLTCAVINSAFAVQTALAGNYAICGLCCFFAFLCFNNFRKAA